MARARKGCRACSWLKRAPRFGPSTFRPRSADLAERLLTVAPKLRAKGADRVVYKLLSDDALVASKEIAGMSDRGLRRLFDGLVDLGALHELSGRTTSEFTGCSRWWRACARDAPKNSLALNFRRESVW
ncbi:DUF1403 family protein [Mesorhizobium sp. M0036]|uniref:DUF1403 family protein n=1 Tax=Mesorhizobium sp. M0036 TaxID=2956853 RepID=UPI003337BECC